MTKAGQVTVQPNLVLTNTFYIPDFKYNLISVHKLTMANHLNCTFLPTHCVMQEPTSDKVLATGKLEGNLYTLKMFRKPTGKIHQAKVSFTCLESLSNSSQLNSALAGQSQINSFKLKHQRLGHVSAKVLQKIKCVPFVFNSTDMDPCIVCHTSKQHRLPFSRSIVTASNIFYLIHANIWGPFMHHSISSAPYFFTLLDDRSRATWIFFIKHKSQTVKVLSNFVKSVQTQYGLTIKAFRTDNGGEFTSCSCQQFLNEFGIIHQRTTPYTPQQNRRVERKHKELLNLARSLLFQANLSLKFWADTIHTAVYITNRLPSPVINWKTPFEILQNHQPDYSHMKTFGCLCFVANTVSHKSKFDVRGFKCIFLGYLLGQRAYKAYDVNTHKVLISRDIIFYENVFPFLNNGDIRTNYLEYDCDLSDEHINDLVCF